MDRLTHIPFNPYDAFPKLAESTFPVRANIPVAERRETTISQDRFNEIHIRQVKDGITHIVSMDRKEAYYILTALESLLTKEK